MITFAALLLWLPLKAINSQTIKEKKRVTAGEVDKLEKELGNCTLQWTTNDDTNTQALSTLSLLQVKDVLKMSLLLLSFFLLLPEEDLVSKALVCLYHRSSSIGEYSVLVLFLTCLPHQQLLAFSPTERLRVVVTFSSLAKI